MAGIGSLGSRLENAFVMEMMGTYMSAASQFMRREKFITAMIGNYERLISNSECLRDMGLILQAYYLKEGRSIFYNQRELNELSLSDYDLYIVGGRNLAEEEELLYRFLEHTHQLGRISVPIYRCTKIIDGLLEAMIRIAELRSCLNVRKLSLVAQLLACTPHNGIIAECGVYQGGTTVLMAKLLELWQDPRRILAFDTFEGMPEPTAADSETVYQAGLFSDSPLPSILRYFEQNEVAHRIRPVQGLVQDTLPTEVRHDDQISFALIDTDQYAGTAAGLSVMVPNLACNGILLIDDYTVQGVRTAVDESLRHHPGLRGAPLTTNFYMLWKQTDNNFLSAVQN
jgi:hypothetical protein